MANYTLAQKQYKKYIMKSKRYKYERQILE
jgi:hypothetical protein